MIKAVSFDFDGTLVQSNEIKRRIFFEVGASLGDVEPILKKILDSKTGDRNKIFGLLVNEVAKNSPLPRNRSKDEWVSELVSTYSDECEKQIIAAKEVLGANDCLKKLKGLGIPLFVVSATPKEALDSILKARGMSTYFQQTYGKHSFKGTYLKEIIRKLNILPQELLHVGDQMDDFQGATEARCRFIGVGANIKNIPMERSVSDMSEVLEWIRNA